MRSFKTSDGLRFYHRSSEIIGNLLIKNSAAMFVVDNMKTRQRRVDPGNQLEFHFDICKLFISVLLSSPLVTFLIAVSRSKNVLYGQLLI